MKKLVPCAVMLCLLSVQAAPAQAAWWQFFFPTLKQAEDDPAQTLTAPFAPQPAGPHPPPTMARQQVVKPLPENSVSLDKPHRTTKQVAEWLSPICAEALTFASADYKGDLAKTEPRFDTAGRQEYLKFLLDNNIQKVLDLNKYVVRSYVQDTPLLLNEGAAGGRYHWLFEIPVMVSYLDKSVKDYSKGQPINQMIVLKVQVGRSGTTPDPMGVSIGHWSGRGVKLEKK